MDHLIGELESLNRRDKAKVIRLLKRIITHLLFLQEEDAENDFFFINSECDSCKI
ncbi:MAG: DUF29 family protein [Microcystaceae cyanobacterium]